jgi:hypothetical protein
MVSPRLQHLVELNALVLVDTGSVNYEQTFLSKIKYEQTFLSKIKYEQTKLQGLSFDIETTHSIISLRDPIKHKLLTY